MYYLVARLILFLTGSLFIGIKLVAVIASEQPPKDFRSTLLGSCDGSPCVIDLVPGSSPWTKIQPALQGFQGDFLDRQISITWPLSTEVSFYRSVDKLSLGRIQINYRIPFSVGWLIIRYGKPCGITIYHSVGMITIRYPFLLANVNFQTNVFNPNMAITTIQYNDPHYISKAQPNICVDNITDGARNRSWRGFAPIWFYLRQ